MKKLTVAVLIVMLLLITYAVTFCTPKQKYYELTATAYYPGIECCYPYNDGFTATGDKAGKGSVAIDPKGPLKMGQKVYVEGYGYGVCNDIGSAIKGWKIDLCFDTYEEAIEWGVKLVKVYMIKE
jgi:3D (Asp-Asp-Asp) domain-containing protein